MPQKGFPGEEHWKVCEYFKCYRCQASWPVAEQDDHSKSCAKTLPSWCNDCHRCMPASEIKGHKKACNTQRYKAGTKEQIEAHLRECSRKRCSLCRRVIEIDGGHDCPNSRCSLCLRDFPEATEDLHLAQCTGPKLKDCISSETAPRLNPSQVTSNLLSPATKYPISSGCISTMIAWLEQPVNTAIADFEFLIFPGGRVIPFQVAIANGNGKWIVPRTTINHGVTKTLLEKARLLSIYKRSMWVDMIHKFYPGDLDNMTEGLNGQEITDLVDQYIKV